MLSDANKRFLYDVGVYDSGDDDDQNVITLSFIIISCLRFKSCCLLLDRIGKFLFFQFCLMLVWGIFMLFHLFLLVERATGDVHIISVNQVGLLDRRRKRCFLWCSFCVTVQKQLEFFFKKVIGSHYFRGKDIILLWGLNMEQLVSRNHVSLIQLIQILIVILKYLV